MAAGQCETARSAGQNRPFCRAKRNWISVYFHSDVPDDEIKRLVRQAYETVASTLPKGQRERLAAM